MKFAALLLASIAVTAVVTAQQLVPKMIVVPADNSRRLASQQGPAQPRINTLSSNFALFTGTCTPDSPMQFKLTGGGVRGTGGIGVMGDTDTIIGVDLAQGDGAIQLTGDFKPDFFGFPKGSASVAYRIDFTITSPEGGVAHVTCDRAAELAVVYKDASSVGHVEVTMTRAPGNGQSVRQSFTLTKGTSVADMKADIKQNANNGGAVNMPSANSAVVESSASNVILDSSDVGDIALIQLEMDDGASNKAYRTVLSRTGSLPPKIEGMTFDASDLNENGDLVIQFDTQSSSELHLTARVAIIPTGTTNKVEGDYDVTAVVSNGQLILHAGWVSTALEKLGLPDTDDYEIMIVDAVAKDPANNYQEVRHLRNPGTPANVSGNGKRRLSRVPTNEERAISQEMKFGRRSAHTSKKTQNDRNLQTSGVLVLVHGYCATESPFPVGDFDNAAVFLDPERPVSRSHMDFAKQIGDFVADFDSCSIVAHSQGGAASLTLYTYFHSCLDNATDGRLLQSVGTPYQGTALAGDLATLGDVFGVGCGRNEDLTYKGAAEWLSNIPSSARAEVYYHTTSFPDLSGSYDYCDLSTDSFLEDPEDGTAEYKYSQLPGANNMGHKTGWCHSTDMNYPPQCTDSSRNTVMNSEAAR